MADQTEAESNRKVFTSGIFVFQVCGTEFTAHRELVARISGTLRALMENGMRESQKGCATLPNVSESTFARFLEFAYTGDYNADPATGVCDQKPRASGLEAMSLESDGMPDDPLSIPKSAGRSNRVRKRARLASRDGNQGPRLPSLVFKASPKSPLPANSKYHKTFRGIHEVFPIFMTHAKLYVFADEYDVPELRELAAGRLYSAVSEFEYHLWEAPEELAELVSYVYEHTADRDEEIDKLRAVIVQFCVLDIRLLHGCKSFRELLQGGGSFASDLVSWMAQFM